jgi:hypothetical protein
MSESLSDWASDMINHARRGVPLDLENLQGLLIASRRRIIARLRASPTLS